MEKLLDMTEEERIEPIRITDNSNGKMYTLDFDRKTVKKAELEGFKITETFDYPNVNVPRLFWYAFQMHHSNVPLDKIDALRDKMGGLTDKIAVRLVDLYRQATMANNVLQSDEDLAKNSEVTVEL